MSSKLPAYRRNAYQPTQPALHPYQKEQPSRLAQKSRLGRSRLASSNSQYTPQKRGVDNLYHIKVTQRKRNQTQFKIQTLLQQNKYLLSENSELSSLVAERGQMILALEQKLQQQMGQEIRTLEEIEFQKNRFIQEFQIKTKEYDRRIQALLDEIGDLHQQIHRMDLQTQGQMDDMKVHSSIEHKRQIQSLLQSHHKTTQILQLEVTQLRQIIEQREHEHSEMQYEFKTINQRNRQQISSLNEQISHLNHMKRLQLSEQKVQYENVIHGLTRESKKQQQVTILNYQMQLKKIKNQLNIKKIEAQQLESEVEMGKIENETKENQMFGKKAQLETQILQLQRKNKELLFRQKQNLMHINESELQIVNATHKSQSENLISEIEKLRTINSNKNEEIKRLLEQINQLRSTKNEEIQLNERTIEELKQRMGEMKRDNQEDDEAFKTKMAQLHHADVQAIRNYYENQIAVQMQDLQNRQQVIKENREKVHKEIQEKTELRKIFESEVSKLKVRIGQLQLKLAESQTERREQQANMNSKIEVTSMSLIRETSQKQKYALFYQQERRKYQILITTKDQQIATLQDKINQLRQDYAQQLQEKQENINLANKKCDDLQKSLKKQQFFYQNQLKKKEAQNLSDKKFYEEQIERMKSEHSNQFGESTEKLVQEKTLLQSERNQLYVRVKELNAELSQTRQHRQQQGLDKDIVLVEEQRRLKNQKGLLEVSLRNFYQTQIKDKNQEIKDLHQQIRQKEQDIREGAQKYHKLDKKLNQLLQSQQKLRDIQNKVMAIGEDNSAIKSLAQLLRNRKRQ